MGLDCSLHFKFGFWVRVMNKSYCGFTLIEVMIVVLIISILTAVAYPSYQEHVRKSRRSECEGVMMTIANALERRYSVGNTYLDGAGAGSLPTGVPATCPADGGVVFYNLNLVVPNASTFTLSAVPAGAQAQDKCGTLTLMHTGAKGQVAGMTAADCWR